MEQATLKEEAAPRPFASRVKCAVVPVVEQTQLAGSKAWRYECPQKAAEAEALPLFDLH